jgi:hypothetical protein
MAKTIDQMSQALEKLIAKVDKLEIENKDLKEQKNKDPNKKTIQQAKDNVPQLNNTESYRNFYYYLREFLNLKPKLCEFLETIELPDDREVLTPSQLYTKNKGALKIAESIDVNEMHDFYVWIVSKIHSDNETLHKKVNKKANVAKRLLELWYNILKKFNRNSSAARTLEQRKFDTLEQPNDIDFSWTLFEKFADKVIERAKIINNLWIGFTGSQYSDNVPKIHDDEIWDKIKYGLNEEYKEKLDKIFELIDEKPGANLREKLARVEAKLVDKGFHDETKCTGDQEFDSRHSAMMARTNVPKKRATDSEYSRVTMHKDYLKNLVCNNWNGRPDSCHYGNTCKFLHINNEDERNAAIAKQKRFFKQRRQRRSEGEDRKQKEGDYDSDGETRAQIARLKQRFQRKRQTTEVRAMLAELENLADEVDHDDCHNDYEDYLDEHGIPTYTECSDSEDQVEGRDVVSSLALPELNDLDSSDDDSMSSEGDIQGTTSLFSSNIEKETKRLNLLKQINNTTSDITARAAEQRRKKRMNILIEKAKRKREKIKNDYEKLTEIKQNVLKEEERAKKIRKEKERKKKELELKTKEEEERQKNELKKIMEETELYKGFMERDMSDENDKSESDCDMPIKIKRPRGSLMKGIKPVIFWSVKWFLLIISGLAIVGAVIKLPSYVNELTAPTVRPSTASKINKAHHTDTGHSFLIKGRRNKNNIFNSGRSTILDSGTTWHLTGDITRFIGKLTKLDRPRKILGFDSATSDGSLAWYKGTIEVQATVGGKSKTILLKEALYVPCMKNLTLISQGQLDDEGHKFVTVHGKGRCFNPDGSSYFDVRKRRGLYHIGKPTVSFLAMNKDTAHRKFGHINGADLDTLGDWSGSMSP